MTYCHCVDVTDLSVSSRFKDERKTTYSCVSVAASLHSLSGRRRRWAFCGGCGGRSRRIARLTAIVPTAQLTALTRSFFPSNKDLPSRVTKMLKWKELEKKDTDQACKVVYCFFEKQVLDKYEVEQSRRASAIVEEANQCSEK